MRQFALICGMVALIAPARAQVGLPGVFSSNPASRVMQEGFGNQVVKGKPFSATEERHSLQVLGDATRIENTETDRLYRDNQGRTRVEQMNGTVIIHDPSAGTTVELDPATKTARQSKGRIFVYSSGNKVVTFNGGESFSTWNTRPNATSLQGVMAETTENLPAQAVNGVTAQGIRTTMTIPKGQIGNNREIKVVTERWYSNDLQMLIKSVNNDPRFGDTTYQLTRITQSEPDAALFQIPAGYTVETEAQGLGFKRPAVSRAGVGVAPAPAKPPAPPNQ